MRAPTQSVTGQVLKIVALRPDAVMTGGAGTPVRLPFLALTERGFKGGVYGQHGLINPDFIRVAGGGRARRADADRAGDRRRAASDNYPTKKVALDFRAAFQKVNGAPTTDAFSAYRTTAGCLLDAATRAVAKGEPGTPEFRVALRDAIATPRRSSARTASTT